MNETIERNEAKSIRPQTVEIEPESYERTDRQLEAEPEYQHLVEICSELGLSL